MLSSSSISRHPSSFFFFFFNDTATTEIYTLSLHDALPISFTSADGDHNVTFSPDRKYYVDSWSRSEEHTSELQSHLNLVCRLLLEKKKKADSTEMLHQWRIIAR